MIALLPDVDRETRTLTARVALENPNCQLSPGMYVSLDFTGPAGEPQLARAERGSDHDRRAQRRDRRPRGRRVRRGGRHGRHSNRDGRSTILSGLNEGQSVVVSGQFLIDSEASLKATLQSARSSRARIASAGAAAVIARLIRWSIDNRFLVLLATLMIAAWGVWAMLRTPLDAIPDLSDVQVIIRTTYPGQAPQIVENQVTYPLATTMMSVPGAKTVRGYSMFGDSFVYILFEDGTDPYWARSRVLEYLNQVQSRLPAQAKASLGPDATGVGWVYEYALVDQQRHDGSVAVARAAGLVSEVRAQVGAERVRGGFRRRHGEAVPDRARSGSAARLQPSRTRRSSRRCRRRTRRPAARSSSWARPSTWCARRAICSRSMIFARFL